MYTFQAVLVQLALCLVVGSDGGNVLARAQPLSSDDGFSSRRGRDENLCSFNDLPNASGDHDLDTWEL